MNTDTKHFLIIFALSLFASFQPALIIEYFNFNSYGITKYFNNEIGIVLGVPLFIVAFAFGVVISLTIKRESTLSTENIERELEEYRTSHKYEYDRKLHAQWKADKEAKHLAKLEKAEATSKTKPVLQGKLNAKWLAEREAELKAMKDDKK